MVWLRMVYGPISNMELVIDGTVRHTNTAVLYGDGVHPYQLELPAECLEARRPGKQVSYNAVRYYTASNLTRFCCQPVHAGAHSPGSS